MSSFFCNKRSKMQVTSTSVAICGSQYEEYRSAIEMKAGDDVQLQGMANAPYLNGRSGIITEAINDATGIIRVELLEAWVDHQGQRQHHPLSLKPENLRRGAKRTFSCAGCKGMFRSKDVSKCSGCRMIRYCSRECQKSHWKEEHKKDARYLQWHILPPVTTNYHWIEPIAYLRVSNAA